MRAGVEVFQGSICVGHFFEGSSILATNRESVQMPFLHWQQAIDGRPLYLADGPAIQFSVETTLVHDEQLSCH